MQSKHQSSQRNQLRTNQFYRDACVRGAKPARQPAPCSTTALRATADASAGRAVGVQSTLDIKKQRHQPGPERRLLSSSSCSPAVMAATLVFPLRPTHWWKQHRLPLQSLDGNPGDRRSRLSRFLRLHGEMSGRQQDLICCSAP